MMRQKQVLAWFCMVLMAVSLMCSPIALAEKSAWRDLLCDAEAKPLELPSLQAHRPFEPVFCTPDQLVAALQGYVLVEPLTPVFEDMGITLGTKDIGFTLPEGGKGAFLRDGLSIARRAFPNVIIGGEHHDVQTVTLGHESYNFTFIFLVDSAGVWQLMDAIPSFYDITTQSNGENTWLVGIGHNGTSVEMASTYERWYNLKTLAIDISLVDKAVAVANKDDGNQYYAFVVTHLECDISPRQLETGEMVQDITVRLPRYVSLCQVQEGEDASIRELDAYSTMSIYHYDADSYSLKESGNWSYDTISPAVLEFAADTWFGEDMLHGQ